MTRSAGQARSHDDAQGYEIRLQGHLDSRWAERLQGLALRRERDGTTTLTGLLSDQSALHGLLGQVRDLGLPIVSIRRIQDDGHPGDNANDTISNSDNNQEEEQS